MKNCGLFFILFIALSCSKENVRKIDVQKDLSELLPNKSFDSEARGLYHGIIVSNDTNLHGKIWINLGNDENYNALVKTLDNQIFSFTSILISTNDTYFHFEGTEGEFDFDVSNINNPKAENVYINHQPGFINVIKEKDGQKAAAVLGTYSGGPYSGTWDFLVGSGETEINKIVITTASGFMIEDNLVNFESNIIECYPDDLTPFFINDIGSGLYELFAPGQIWNLDGGGTILYDFGFSKSLADLNNFEYSTGLFYPYFWTTYTGTTVTPNPACYFFNGFHGLFRFNDVTGTIQFDTSSVPLPTTSRNLEKPLINNITSDYFLEFSN